MIWGLTVGNHCYTITNVFSFAPLSIPISSDCGIQGIFIHLELAKGSLFLSHYSRRYYFRLLFNLGVSLKDIVCTCLYHCF